MEIWSSAVILWPIWIAFICSLMAVQLCRPGGCNLVMWHHGASRPLLEIALGSLCGLALPNYLFCHSHCWTGELQDLSAVRQKLEPAKQTKSLTFSQRSLIPTMCSWWNHMSQHFTSGTRFFFFNSFILGFWEDKKECDAVGYSFPLTQTAYRYVCPDAFISVLF